MSINVEALGPLRDIAQAIGIIGPDGQFEPNWFASPGDHVANMLREPFQREALLRAAGQLLSHGTPPEIDGAGRRWVRLVTNGGVALHMVIALDGTTAELGIGAQLRTANPESQVRAYVPLLRFPANGAAAVALSTLEARVWLEAEVTIEPQVPAPGAPNLRGLRLQASVGANGNAPRLSVALLGLQLPGQPSPEDVELGDDPAALTGEAIRLLAGIVRRAAPGAPGELAHLLALAGLAGDPLVPDLPIAEIIANGAPAWRTWLGTLLANPSAVAAWLSRLAQLVGPGAAMSIAAASGLPHRVSWTAASGWALAISVTIGRTPAGAPMAEIGFEARLATPGALPAAMELSAVLARLILGEAPSVAGLPAFDAAVRIGPATIAAPSDRLVDAPAPAPRIGSLRTGLTLTQDRHMGLVLSLHDVLIGAHDYGVLDLTNAQTLAEVAGSAVADLAAQVFGRLGPAAAAVEVLLGVAAPPGQANWPVPLTTLPDLLADPVSATVGYHARVLGQHRPGYPAVLDPLRALLALPTINVPVDGVGEADLPWRLRIADGIAVTAWTAGDSLAFGLAVERSVADLGGGCPTVELGLVGRLASISLSGGGGHAFPGAVARIVFGARNGVQLQIGNAATAILADRAGVELRWGRETGLQSALVMPGLAARIDGEQVPIALPTLDANGRLIGDVPWRAIELLFGRAMAEIGQPWSDRATELLGWIPLEHTPDARLSLAALVADPLPELRAWMLAHIRNGNLTALARSLALAITGPAIPGLSAGLCSGRGDGASPLAVPMVRAASAAPRRAELTLWANGLPAAEASDVMQALRILSETGAGDGAVARLGVLLSQAGERSAAVAEALLDRGDMSAGFAALVARWADSDGLTRQADAMLPGATVHDVADAACTLLPELDLLALTGVELGAGTVVASGPLGPETWTGIAEDHILDLRIPRVVPEAFDLARVAAADGPWLVLLSSRADCAVDAADDGSARQVARLARVVDAVASRVGAAADGTPVVVVGYGAAGHAAVAVASRPGVTHLITLGTPHGGIGLDVLETQPVSGALQLLAALVPPRDPARRESAAASRGRGLLEALLLAYEAPINPLIDLAPPPGPVELPKGVEAHCVRGVCDATSVARAIAALLALGLEVEQEALVLGANGAEAVSLGWGLGILVDSAAAPGALHVTARLALAGTVFGAAVVPALRVRIGIGRVGGWLSGGPDPARPAAVARHPSLRRADVELVLGPDGAASTSLIFHEANALGVARARWTVSADGGGDPLYPEARVLVGRLAAALGPVPDTGELRQLVDLLAAVGLLEGTVATGSMVGFSVDGMRHLLVDSTGLLRDVTAGAGGARVASAIAVICGGTMPAPGIVQAVIDGLSLRAELTQRTVRIESTGLSTDAGALVSGAVELQADGKLGGQLAVALGSVTTPNGRPVIELSGPPFAARLRWEGGGGSVPGSVALAPQPDAAGLGRLLATAVPPCLLWAGITFIRSLQAGTVALVDPVLRAFGLLDGTGGEARVPVPVALFANPQGWLTHATVLGDGSSANLPRLRALLDAIAGLIGIPQPDSGRWTLPYGIELAVDAQAGRSTITLRVAGQAGAGLGASGMLGVALGGPGTSAAMTGRLTLALPDGNPIDSTGRIELSVGPAGLAARLVLPASGIDLQLLPNGPGLGALGAAAVLYALPLALDAVTGVPQGHPARAVADALEAAGDALGLRAGGHFVASELQALAADPARQLAQRLARNLHIALDALAALVAPGLAAEFAIGRMGNDLVFRRNAAGAGLELHLTAPAGSSGAGARLTGSFANLQPFAGATLGGTIGIASEGFTEAGVAFAIDPANAAALGRIRLAPLAEIAIGSAPAGGGRLAVGLAVDPQRSVRGVLRFGPPPTFALEAVGGSLPELLARLLLPPMLDLAIAAQAVTALLDRVELGGVRIRELLAGVALTGPQLDRVDPGALDTVQLWQRLLRLAANVAGHTPRLPVDPLVLRIVRRADAGDDVFGISVTLPPGQRYPLIADGVTIGLEVDASWISGPAAPEGLLIELLRVHQGTAAATLSISVRGLGLRFGRTAGPLLDTALVLDTVALHGLAGVAMAGGVTDAGGQLELGGLRIMLGSPTGGTNKVASGVLRDSTSARDKPAPRLSPALSVQRHGNGLLRFDLRAGEGDGPWWIAIQRGFGPVYLEQVGFGVSRDGDRVIAARVIVDGKVSLLGLTASVEDLALGAQWPQAAGDPPIYDPASWQVDLAGLAVSANTGGVSIEGALRRSPGLLPDYIGMVSIRFGVFGISGYGAYTVVSDEGGDFTSLFIFGALNAPIGGPPAFFVTGIGAGVGVNRLLLLPADLNEFPSYPLLRALDRYAPVDDPDAALAAMRALFPPARASFWFAAGLAFTSFALVDAIAVVAVAIGDGLDFNLLGLARAALPTPALPLAQIELALLVRFSTREGVLWIQAQLTDNSFLLTRDCRLTGGFAYVIWFEGDKAGEFVVTLGGYHPSFHRDGYPAVPRLGFIWDLGGVLVIKGDTYFALTSDAIMAGIRLEASLTLGPLWAYMRLGCDGIIYFDPFHFQVRVFAELGAGITIDVDLGWFGHIRITLSVNLGADVLLEGPAFRGQATFEIYVISVTIAFGDWTPGDTPALGWDAFKGKYLRPNDAAMLTIVPGRGALPPSPDGDRKTPTGAADDPLLLLPEFVLTVTTTAASSALDAAGPVALPLTVILGIGPMQVASVSSTLAVSVTSQDGAEHARDLAPAPLTGQFPRGVWAAQPQSEPKPIPTAETVEAVNGVVLTAEANIAPGTVPVDYHQVSVGRRHRLPFLAERRVRGNRAVDVADAAQFAAGLPTEATAVLAQARCWLTSGPNGAPQSPLGAVTFVGSRVAPPQLVPLRFRMEEAPAGPVAVPAGPPHPARPPIDTSAHAPRVEGVLAVARLPSEQAAPRTTVGGAAALLRRTTPMRLAEAKAALNPRLPLRLIRAVPSAAQTDDTIIPAGRAPRTARAGMGPELRRETGQAPWRSRRLQGLTQAIADQGADLVGAEIFVLAMPNGGYDVDADRPRLNVSGPLPVRVVAIDTAGDATLDVALRDATIEIPPHTARTVLVGGADGGRGAPGWHSSALLVQVGTRTLLGAGCTITTARDVSRRPGAGVSTGFIVAADAVRDYTIATTRLPAGIDAVAVILESVAADPDPRGDALDLGLAGARRAPGPTGAPLPPTIVVGGSRTAHVYAIEPVDGATQVEITVATGESFHLGGVLGRTGGAAALAGSLAMRDLPELLGALIDVAQGQARVRWIAQRTAPHDPSPSTADPVRR